MVTSTSPLNKTHTIYKLKSGQRVPSCTTILGILDKPALKRWYYECGLKGIDPDKQRDQAAGIGTLAHYMVECDIKGAKADPEYLAAFSPADMSKAENSFLAYLDWRKSSKADLQWSEAVMVSEAYGFGGTVDCIGMIGGERYLVDWKTSSGIYSDYTIQVAAYEYLWEECHPDQLIDGVIICRLGKDDGAFEVKSISSDTRAKAWELFVNLLRVYELKKEIK